MKKNILIISFIFSLILSSCGAPDTKPPITSTGTTIENKTPYIVKTIPMDSGSGVVYVEKTWRITASSSLTLTSQWAWEIGKILVKEGQNVKAGTTIAVLKDTVNNFDIRLSQAENALAVQDASINTTKVNLSQAVDNARIWVDRARQAYDTLTAKNGIQYDSVVNTNGKTLDSYNQNYKSYLSDVERLMTQYLYEGDKILGMSTNFEYTNDGWEAYLWARNGTSFADAKNEWNKLYAARWAIRAKLEKSVYMSSDTLTEDLELVWTGYTSLQKYADAMILMTQNNIVGAGLSQDLQTGWIAAWNWYKASVQWAETGFNAWKGQTISFFKSYKNTELATKLALESLSRTLTAEERSIIEGSLDMKVTYESARISLADAMKSARLWVEQAELAYDNALKIQEVTLTQLDATRRNAELSLDQARRDYSKLSISTPVDGNITKVIASVGQTVNVGSAIAEFSGKMPQVVLDIDTSLASTLMTGDTVIINTDEATLSGTITAVSSVSNANLLSTVRISVQNGEKYIGQSVTVTFKSQAGKTENNALLLPINAVKIISEEEWEVYTLWATGALTKKIVKLGKVGDTNIEIFGTFEKEESLIISDMSNYDEAKNTLSVQ
jgi:multidrug efflux pump subunit AcrA (membrane-fusion protein)